MQKTDFPQCHVIDVHTHVLPPEIPNWEERFGYPGFVGLAKIEGVDTTDRNMLKGTTFFRRVQCNCFDPDVRVKDMDASDVSVQVLSTVPIMFNYWAKSGDCLETSRFLNDHLASVCSQNPSRFVGLGTVPMQDCDMACEELRRCVSVLKLKGVEIGTNINGKNLDDPMFDKFWKTVEEIDAVVFVHPWDMMGGERMEKHWLSWLVAMPAETATAISCMIFGGVYKKYPKLKVYYAHGGGSFIGVLERIQRGFDCRPDLYPEQCSPRDYLNRIRVDSLTHDPDTLQLIVSKIGPDNVMVGSDYPFPLGEPEDIGKSVRAFCSKYGAYGMYKKLMYQNACAFFGIDLAEKPESVRKEVSSNSKETHKITHAYYNPALDISYIATNPVHYSNYVSVAELVNSLKELCKAYYVNESPLVDNKTYDTMVSILRSRDAHNKFFVK